MEKTVHLSRNRKVIPLEMDAAFFLERAVQSLDRYRYDRALKYFRRAAEFEPNNPVNHCNMAGILSEMGQYDESNRILQYVVERIDPSMTECYFYMANNYANMELFEEAEEALIYYLEHDPLGYYIEESAEMMEMLSYELERPPKLKKIKSREGILEHDRARALLEEGKFMEAITLLETLVKMYPKFTAAHNNLALAYYYVGRFQDAMDAVQQVLADDPGNLHGLCNLAIFHHFAGNDEALEELVCVLRKTVPFHPEHAFKLATTLGVLGEHEEALKHFRRLLKSEADACLYHYAAAACFNLGRFQEARRYWIQAEKLDPSSDVPKFYLAFLQRIEEDPAAVKPAISYHYHLPYEEQFRQLQQSQSSTAAAEHLHNDPLIRSTFFWALRHGDKATKLKMIQTCGTFGDPETAEVLREMLRDPLEDDCVKRAAVIALRRMNVKEPLPAVISGREVVIEKDVHSPDLPVWKASWQGVIDLALERMAERYDMVQQFDAATLWVEFLSRSYPSVPKISKIEGWAGALEYLTAKMHRKPITYQEVARKYGVSITTVSRNAKLIDDLCRVREKLNTVFANFQENL